MPYSLPPSRPTLRDPLISQRNPFEIYLLIFALLLGVASVCGFPVSPTMNQQSYAVVLMWGLMLTIGCATGLVGVSLPLRHLGIGLQLERFGMIMLAGGVLVYAWVVGHSVGWDAAWPVGTNIAFGVACATRVVQITRRYSWYARLHKTHTQPEEPLLPPGPPGGGP